MHFLVKVHDRIYPIHGSSALLKTNTAIQRFNYTAARHGPGGGAMETFRGVMAYILGDMNYNVCSSVKMSKDIRVRTVK